MLQGSLDDFSLDEVLGLLSSTTKSGRLRLSGDRGTGSLWLSDGDLNAAEASKIPGKTGIEDVMFEMLRFEDGTFSFMIDEVPAIAGDSETVKTVVDSAQKRLVEWRSIENVVPSLAHVVSLAEDLPSDELSLSSQEWKTILAVNKDSVVEAICDGLGLDEVDGSRRIMQMIERGLLTIDEPVLVAPSAVVVEESSMDSNRPPMPVPPSPAEIESFSSELDASSPFANGELLDEALVGADDDSDSVLMTYLKGDK